MSEPPTDLERLAKMHSNLYWGTEADRETLLDLIEYLMEKAAEQKIASPILADK